MRDVLDAVRDDARAAQERREANRARWPELARVMDELGSTARLRAIYEGGVLVMGRAPEPDDCAVVSGLCDVETELAKRRKK